MACCLQLIFRFWSMDVNEKVLEHSPSLDSLMLLSVSGLRKVENAHVNGECL